MPPWMRESPACCAASLNVANEIVVSAAGIPGSTRPKFGGIVVENPKLSLPVNSRRTLALALENIE